MELHNNRPLPPECTLLHKSRLPSDSPPLRQACLKLRCSMTGTRSFTPITSMSRATNFVVSRARGGRHARRRRRNTTGQDRTYYEAAGWLLVLARSVAVRVQSRSTLGSIFPDRNHGLVSTLTRPQQAEGNRCRIRYYGASTLSILTPRRVPRAPGASVVRGYQVSAARHILYCVGSQTVLQSQTGFLEPRNVLLHGERGHAHRKESRTYKRNVFATRR